MGNQNEMIALIHAKWETVDEEGDHVVPYCANCHGEATYTYDGGFDKSNYCPRCGAKMDL